MQIMSRDSAFRDFGDHVDKRYVIVEPRFPKVRNHDKIKLILNFRISELINQDLKLIFILLEIGDQDFTIQYVRKTHGLSRYESRKV
jgi:hypothetical protein